MPTDTRSEIRIPPGFRSAEAASFVAQLDDQLALLRGRTRDLAPEELAWQPGPGMNTIGMLLAHLAIVEVWWTKIVLGGEEDADVTDVLGIGVDDDGMPLAEGAAPPAVLSGRDLGFYDDLLARARRHLTEAATSVTPEALEQAITRTRADGSKRTINVRWYFYHLLEHFAGHYGQILLLRHLRRAAATRP